jgi:Tfp pilus assembly protein PilN
VLLGAATSFPFRQTSSSGAITSAATHDQEIVGNSSGSAADGALELQQQAFVQDVSVIAPLARGIPPSIVLATLARALPGGVAVSELSLATRDSTEGVTFTVMAQDRAGANSFAKALSSEEMFEKVHLIPGISRAGGLWRSQVQMAITPTRAGSRPVFSESGLLPASIAASKGESDRLQRDIAMLDTVLPEKSSIDSFQKQIVQLAAANSLQLSSIKSLPSQELFGCIEQPVEISISGSFNGFYSFLLQLESLPRLKDLSQLRMRQSAEHNGDTEAELRVDVFSKLRPG